jgi:lipoprotein-releasing system permease protein
MTDPTPSPPPSGQRLDLAALPAVVPGSPYVAEVRIAIRHLMSKKADAMISIVAVLSVLGVLGAVALVNVVLAVMTGFQVDLRDKILGAQSHVIVQNIVGQMRDHDVVVSLADQMPQVKGAAAFVYGETIIKSKARYSGVVLKGFDPARSDRVTALASDLTVGPKGRLDDDAARLALFRSMDEPTTFPTMPDLLASRLLTEAAGTDGLIFRVREPVDDAAPADGAPAPEGFETDPAPSEPAAPPETPAPTEGEPLPGIFIGLDLAILLEVGPGSELQLVDPFGGGMGPMGMPNPRIKRVRVAGVYQSGFPEYDAKYTYMANSVAQDYLRMGDSVTGVEVALHELYDAPVVAQGLDAALSPLHYSRTWMEMNRDFYEALALERQVTALVLSSTLLIAGLLIVCVLIMMVLTKTREIAILRAMGASAAGILRIFILEGTLIGLVGSLAGTGLGLLVCWLLKLYGFPINGAVYFLNTLPVQVDPLNVVGIAVGAVVCCFLATLYPAWSAARIDPVEGLRYE